jgi:hypothetical protein
MGGGPQDEPRHPTGRGVGAGFTSRACRRGTALLSLVNGLGQVVAPVVDASNDVLGRRVRVALTVSGLTTLVDVRPERWIGNTSDLAVLYVTGDCSGQGYIAAADSAGAMFPLAVAVGISPSEQILHVADNSVPVVALSVASSRSYGDNNCSSLGPAVTNNLLPVVTTLALSTLGPSPFRVVRTP